MPLRFLAPLLLFFLAVCCPAADPWLTVEGKDGPGKGKHVVFVTGDAVNRSEEACPMLARILAEKHGFRCTVLFSVDEKSGEIDPNTIDNIPGLEVLEKADVMVMYLRFRELPDDQMKRIAAWMKAGKPLICLRCSTHAFAATRNKRSPWADWDFQNAQWPGGFGRQIVGTTWEGHHGAPGREGTRGVIEETQKEHPLLRGVTDLHGPGNALAVRNLPTDATVLVRALTLDGTADGAKPAEGKKNETPLPPVVWVKDYQMPEGQKGRLAACLMGTAEDFLCEDLRRLFVNAVYFSSGLEGQIPDKADVTLPEGWKPGAAGFNEFRKKVKPDEAGVLKAAEKPEAKP